MYVPESVASMLARSDVAVIAGINAVLYSGGVPVHPAPGPDGNPPPPGSLLPTQPDQIIGLRVLNVLSGTLPDGPLTVYKVNERFWIGDAELGQRWLLLLSRQGSGRWRTVVSFAPDAVDDVRAEILALRPAEPERPQPGRPSSVQAQPSRERSGRWPSLRRTFGLD